MTDPEIAFNAWFNELMGHILIDASGSLVIVKLRTSTHART